MPAPAPVRVRVCVSVRAVFAYTDERFIDVEEGDGGDAGAQGCGLGTHCWQGVPIPCASPPPTSSPAWELHQGVQEQDRTRRHPGD